MKRAVAVPAARTDAVKETHARLIQEKNDRRDWSVGSSTLAALALGGFSLLIEDSSVDQDFR
jgi:hypothetical protein